VLGIAQNQSSRLTKLPEASHFDVSEILETWKFGRIVTRTLTSDYAFGRTRRSAFKLAQIP